MTDSKRTDGENRKNKKVFCPGARYKDQTERNLFRGCSLLFVPGSGNWASFSLSYCVSSSLSSLVPALSKVSECMDGWMMGQTYTDRFPGPCYKGRGGEVEMGISQTKRERERESRFSLAFPLLCEFCISTLTQYTSVCVWLPSV